MRTAFFFETWWDLEHVLQITALQWLRHPDPGVRLYVPGFLYQLAFVNGKQVIMDTGHDSMRETDEFPFPEAFEQQYNELVNTWRSFKDGPTMTVSIGDTSMLVSGLMTSKENSEK